MKTRHPSSLFFNKNGKTPQQTKALSQNFEGKNLGEASKVLNRIYAKLMVSKRDKEMKRTLPIAVFVLVLGLTSALIVRPASADIESASWLGSFFSWGTDPYYGKSVYGYEENSTATLLVEVENHLSQQMNVSAVIASLDWKTNYTTTYLSPEALKSGETRFFTVAFQVPLTTTASNLYLHGYTVYVKYVNSTGGLIGTMTRAYTSSAQRLFAVYSKDQVAARKLSQVISGITSPIGGFNSTNALLAWAKASNETDIADTMYKQGDFAGAKTHYTTALNYLNQAFSVEETTTGGVQDAHLELLKAQAESFRAQAAYFNGLSNMWVLIGVAAVLFAIGYIIRGLGSLRKPAVASA